MSNTWTAANVTQHRGRHHERGDDGGLPVPPGERPRSSARTTTGSTTTSSTSTAARTTSGGDGGLPQGRAQHPGRLGRHRPRRGADRSRTTSRRTSTPRPGPRLTTLAPLYLTATSALVDITKPPAETPPHIESATRSGREPASRPATATSRRPAVVAVVGHPPPEVGWRRRHAASWGRRWRGGLPPGGGGDGGLPPGGGGDGGLPPGGGGDGGIPPGGDGGVNTTTRRACFLGETLGHVLGSQPYRGNRASRQRSISPNTMSSEPMIAETSASMCPRLRSLGRRSGMAHTRSLCFPSSFTVLACGPFSPISSANATCVPSARRLYAPSSTLFR